MSVVDARLRVPFALTGRDSGQCTLKKYTNCRQLEHARIFDCAIAMRPTRLFWRGLYLYFEPSYRGRTRDATLTRARGLKMLIFSPRP